MRIAIARRNPYRGSATALLVGLLLWLVGCGAPPPPIAELTSSHAALASSESLRLAVLGIELVTALHQDPSGVDCPLLSSEGNRHILDYGGGCAPSSGSTSEGISGQVEFTVAPATGWFVGSFERIGFSNHTVRGELSGSYTPVGDDVFFDLQFTGVQRSDRDDLVLDALFEVRGSDGSYVMDVDGGLLVGPALPDTEFLLSAVTVHNGSLDSCMHPTAGSIELRRGAQIGTLNFSPESASSGTIPFTLNGQDISSIPICS